MIMSIKIKLPVMEITFTYDDLKQMPPKLSSELMAWMNHKNQTKDKSKSSGISNQPQPPLLELLERNNQNKGRRKRKSQPQTPLSELLDAGITKPKMPVRVRLTQEMAQKIGRDFINGMEISNTGTIYYNKKEYKKPSPLADEINKTSLNGWDYVQVKKNNQWIYLKDLRQIYQDMSA